MAENEFRPAAPMNQTVEQISQIQQTRKAKFQNQHSSSNRRSRRQPDPSTWKRNVNKMLKDCGLNYTGANGKVRCAKKTLKRECKCHRSCFSILTEEQIQSLNMEYYSLSYNEQSQYIVGCMSVSAIKRRSRKKSSVDDSVDSNDEENKDDHVDDTDRNNEDCTEMKDDIESLKQEQSQLHLVQPQPQLMSTAMAQPQQTLSMSAQPILTGAPTITQTMYTTPLPLHMTNVPLAQPPLPHNPTQQTVVQTTTQHAVVNMQQQVIPREQQVSPHQMSNHVSSWQQQPQQITASAPIAMSQNCNTMLYFAPDNSLIQMPQNIMPVDSMSIAQNVMPVMVHGSIHQPYMPQPAIATINNHPQPQSHQQQVALPQPTGIVINQMPPQSHQQQVVHQQPAVLQQAPNQQTHSANAQPILSNQQMKPSEKKKSKKKRIRGQNFEYAVKLSGHLIQVCQKAFRAIFGLTLTRVRTLQIKMREGTNIPKDERGRHKNRPNRIDIAIVDRIKHHIRSFPIQESHYPRHKDPVYYLSSDMNVRKMYRLYLEMYEYDQTNPVVKEGLYRSVFNQFNYRFGAKPATKPVCTS